MITIIKLIDSLSCHTRDDVPHLLIRCEAPGLDLRLSVEKQLGGRGQRDRRFNISQKRLWDQLVTPWLLVSLPICNRLSCFLPQGSKAGQPLKPPCRPGFSQNFYTVIVSRDVLHGQSILKGKSATAVSPLLTGLFSLHRRVPLHIVIEKRVSVGVDVY